jgi:hypothetical protein
MEAPEDRKCFRKGGSIRNSPVAQQAQKRRADVILGLWRLQWSDRLGRLVC